MPPCTVGDYDVTVFYKTTYTDKTTFKYDGALDPAPKIFAITPISTSPVLKKIMEITGLGFGTNVNDIKVHLTNSSGRIY